MRESGQNGLVFVFNGYAVGVGCPKSIEEESIGCLILDTPKGVNFCPIFEVS